jgi:MFS family permease
VCIKKKHLQKHLQPMRSKSFILLCVSSFLFFVGFNMIIPELPDFLKKLGGGQYKGFIIAIFTLTACVSRPFSGKLCDVVGRVPVMVFGMVVSMVCTFLYPMLGGVAAFFLLRMVHGLSTGFTPTGTAAYAADIIPAARRGEGLGILSLVGTLGMAVAPVVGSEIALRFGTDALFCISGWITAASVVAFFMLKETLLNAQKFKISHLQIKKTEIIERSAVYPSVVLLLCVSAFGAVVTAVPDISVWLGYENKGVYFLAFTLASVVPRLVAGRASDIYGRKPVVVLGVAFVVVGMCLGLFMPHKGWFLVSGVVYGVGVGMYAPAITAWVVDVCPPQRKGLGVATMYMALELGIGTGSVGAGYLLNVFGTSAHNAPHYVFGLGVVGAVLALVVLLFLGDDNKK